MGTIEQANLLKRRCSGSVGHDSGGKHAVLATNSNVGQQSGGVVTPFGGAIRSGTKQERRAGEHDELVGADWRDEGVEGGKRAMLRGGRGKS
jgi:hypothetical protein